MRMNMCICVCIDLCIHVCVQSLSLPLSLSLYIYIYIYTYIDTHRVWHTHGVSHPPYHCISSNMFDKRPCTPCGTEV